MKASSRGRLRRLGDAGVSEELDPVGAGFADADGAARLAAVLLVVVEHNVSERDRFGGRLLRPVLVEIAF